MFLTDDEHETATIATLYHADKIFDKWIDAAADERIWYRRSGMVSLANELETQARSPLNYLHAPDNHHPTSCPECTLILEMANASIADTNWKLLATALLRAWANSPDTGDM